MQPHSANVTAWSFDGDAAARRKRDGANLWGSVAAHWIGHGAGIGNAAAGRKRELASVEAVRRCI